MKTLLKPPHNLISDTNRTLNKSIERSKKRCCFQARGGKKPHSGGPLGEHHVGLVGGGNGGVVISAREISRQLGLDMGPGPMAPRRTLLQSKRLVMLGSVGALMLALSSVIYMIDPLDVLQEMRLTLSRESFLFDVWKRPPVEVLVKMYVFQVLNAEAFLAGEEKLSFKELGPFVYNEVLVNKNATFNANNTVTYNPSREIFHRPELSCNISLDTRIIVPNVPLLGITAMLAKSSMFTNLALMTLVKYLDAKPFLNVTVEEYLWGYEDPLLTLASTVAPSWITFPKFGLMDRMFDDGHNLVTMNVNEHVTKSPEGRVINPVTLDQYNGSPGLDHWGYDFRDNSTHKICNTLQGIATEGIVFHKNIQKNDTFYVYRKAFCRTMQLVYERAGRLIDVPGQLPGAPDIPVYWYKLPDTVFDNEHPDNSCFQPKKGPVLPRGLSDVTPCYYRFPAAVSLPHFLNADPSLREAVDGMAPNQKDHETYVVMQPDIGVPMQVHSRMQTNIVIGNTKYISQVRPFNNITVPLFWADLTMNNLPYELSSMINLLLNTGPIMQTASIVGLAVVGVILMLFTMAHYWLVIKQSLRSGRRFNISDYTSIKIISSQSGAALLNVER